MSDVSSLYTNSSVEDVGRVLLGADIPVRVYMVDDASDHMKFRTSVDVFGVRQDEWLKVAADALDGAGISYVIETPENATSLLLNH